MTIKKDIKGWGWEVLSGQLFHQRPTEKPFTLGEN